MVPTRTVVLPVGPEHAGLRLDAFLVGQLPWRSRQSVVELIRSGAVRLDGRPTKKSRRLIPNQRVMLTVPVDVEGEAELAALELDIIYEDEDLVVVDKPPDLAVHASSTSMTRNLLARLQHRYQHETYDPQAEPLLVHRLDRTTSGVIAVAKRRELVAFYTQQFERRTTKKTYLAIVEGRPPAAGRITHPLRVVDQQPVTVAEDGLQARTDYERLETCGSASRVRINLHTGRKHQIRVHFAALGHPLVNDNMYGSRLSYIGASGPLLHAASLTLQHRDGRIMTFEAPEPATMSLAWRTLAPP